MPGSPHKFSFRMFGISLTAHGIAAIVFTLPISLLLLAIAWRVVFGY